MKKQNLLKTLFITLSFILLGGGEVKAQSSECTYGNSSTSTSRNYSPYGGYEKFEYLVYLYNANDVNFDGIITNISFKSRDAVNAGVTNFYTIYMKDVPSETTLSGSTTFASFSEGSTLVLERTTTPELTAGWNSTTLTSSFEHSAGNSILVMVKAEGSGIDHHVYYVTNGSHVWYKRNTSDAGTNQSGDLTSYLPCIKFTYGPVACPKPTALTTSNITKNSATLG